ncbi:hypothetical protein P154DRAFT_309946 [Amniculicola lignicola CBS 123094]|uniref:FHA domain-containing protein n=1 Tax=Amniculicola lignicola CBS 123094 TaxID=1392246 RepID=A0A6A5W6E3_9PLEO|nr:hypothetical protein P154DRAFT_309946 [Amniculicola lignicola CBS 123094]
MDSSPSSRASQLPVGTTEPQPESARKPSLLPAFEPLSSSPFPRPLSAKRKFGDESPSFAKQKQQLSKFYPTPVPTSSTGFQLTSPPARGGRPSVQRTISTLSERVPLGAVPTIDIPLNGDVIRMGRSSNSSDYQLSTNRQISRVHVQAAYHGPTASDPHGSVELECLGWNGALVHCCGAVFELKKGETYVSVNPNVEIMLDVQDTRVMIQWPRFKSEWDDDSEDDVSPMRGPDGGHFASSPPIAAGSPPSPTPVRQPGGAGFAGLGGLAPQSPSPVKVFEDGEENDNAHPDQGSPTPADATFIRPSISRNPSAQKPKNFKNILDFANDDSSDDEDGDEENDPVIHSFGPFGENLLPRLASFSTTTPTQTSVSGARRRNPLSTSESPRQRASNESLRFKESPIKNHVINQLAFSRIHSQPLTSIHGNLPTELKACADKSLGDDAPRPPVLTKDNLKDILAEIPCIGEIPRQGKDAAGKALDPEFFYLPEMDTDVMRREAVTSSRGGTGLRNVRKQHKQYYWKRPRV